MGVQGLWELLAPVGRRVSVETLAGKKLAIDASIWMVQFMKAMRDEKGEMLRHAHVLGFFRRICKLLFLRVRPVFVFDGSTPGLKRRTVAARRRRRENATAKLRKTAEKLLLSRLKAKKLEELAAELKNSKQVPDAKGKRVIVDQEDSLAGTSFGEKHGLGSGATDQKSLDELLAASLAAEEEGNLFCSGPSSLVDHIEEEDDGDDSEEMLFPVMNDNIDPTVLASLPPSMQLDLLVQMRERLMAENRQKYQKIKKIPSKFSELQIQSYLKTVAFRREIDEVQKCAAGRGVGGVQTSRIASEANREYIFSSSFTGDKQKLTEGIPERNEAPVLPKDPASDTISHNYSTDQLKCIPQARGYGNSEEFGTDVETYCDEKGRTRVSRVRGLGIRMTRDLQRNLDLIKERENDVSNKNVTSLEGENHVNDKQATVMTRLGDDVPLAHKISTTESGSALEISFSEDDLVRNDTVDDIFSNLVVGGSNSKLSLGSDIFPSDEVTNESDSNNIWEEGMPGDETGRRTINTNLVDSMSQDENVTGEGSDVDWEEGGCCVSAGHSSHNIEDERILSRGTLEEEANLQEAIKRSLNDSRQEILDMAIEKESVIKLGIVDFLPKLKDNMKESQYSHSLINKVDELDGSAGDNTQQGMTSLGGQLTSWRTVAGDSLVTDEAHQCTEVYKDDDKDTNGLEKSSSVKVYSSDSDLLAQQEKCREDLSHTKDQLGLIRPVCGLAKPSSNDQAASILHASDSILVGETNGPHFASNNNKLPEGSFTGIPLEDQLDAVSEFLQNSTEQENSAGVHMDMPRATINEAETWEAREALKLSLDEEVIDLRQECERVGNEQRRLEINAESVSSEMFAECQELLQIFGLPYIIAPMEAEAQCAQMELANLVDGIVTDDSDVFLFGAQTVHKNIFDDRKYVETYLMKDIESELGLTRDKLIRMALLLGSDYTEGVSGIGIVNAIEVVHAFPEDDGLQEFREWLESPDISILSKFESKRKSSKVIARTTEEQQQSSSEASTSDGISEAKKVFMNKHRNVSKNWHIPSSFPSDAVISAYTAPQVDHSTESFSWGKPDLPLLRKVCLERFGWSNQKADEVLLPVLKEHNKHETQLRLEAFYTFNERFAKIRSQRIKKAVKGITGSLPRELLGGFGESHSSCHKDKDSQPKQGGEKVHSRRTAKKQSLGRKSQNMILEEGNAKMVRNNQSGTRGRRGAGKGRGRGRDRGKRKGKDTGDEGLCPEFTDSDSTSGDVKEREVEAISMPRKSARQHVRPNYAEDISEGGSDGLSNSAKEPDDNVVEKETVLDDATVAGESNTTNKHVNLDCMLPGNNSKAVDDDFGTEIKLMEAMPSAKCESKKRLLNHVEGHVGDVLDCSPTVRGPDESKLREAESTDNTILSLEDKIPDNLERSTSADYLLAGGGFCMDDEDPNSNQIGEASIPTNGTEDSWKDVPSSNIERTPKKDHTGAAEADESFGLSAMHSLRKKRRKF